MVQENTPVYPDCFMKTLREITKTLVLWVGVSTPQTWLSGISVS